MRKMGRTTTDEPRQDSATSNTTKSTCRFNSSAAPQTDQPGSDSHFQFLFDANPHPLFISDHKTQQILNVNQSAIDQYGYSRDEFVRMNLAHIRPAGEVANFQKSL